MLRSTITPPTTRKAPTKTNRLIGRIWKHHLFLLLATCTVVFALYITRPYRDVITRLSFSTAYPALILLVITLWIGPWNLLRGQRTPLSSDLRRDIGIWAGILGILHTAIGLCVHLRGRPWLYFVYQHSEGHSFPLRHDIFGFANYTGSVATIILLILFVTSNDYALRRLGTPKWKQLQRWNYVLFVFAYLHTAAYQAMEKQHPPFIATVAIFGAITLLLQALGFQRRRSNTAHRVQV
ncbi:MAG: ferric reductase-like transmembrane domain-containing protein [Acidobacteriota bacterium]